MHLAPIPVPYSCMGIVFIYMYIAPISISSIHERDQTQTYRQHFGIWEPFSPMPPIRIIWEMIPFELSSALFSVNMMTIHAVSLFTRFRYQAKLYEHTTLDPRAHRSITTTFSAWHFLKPDLHETCPDFCAYFHGLVSTLPPANYSVHIMCGIMDNDVLSDISKLNYLMINKTFETRLK